MARMTKSQERLARFPHIPKYRPALHEYSPATSGEAYDEFEEKQDMCALQHEDEISEDD